MVEHCGSLPLLVDERAHERSVHLHMWEEEFSSKQGHLQEPCDSPSLAAEPKGNTTCTTISDTTGNVVHVSSSITEQFVCTHGLSTTVSRSDTTRLTFLLTVVRRERIRLRCPVSSASLTLTAV